MHSSATIANLLWSATNVPAYGQFRRALAKASYVKWVDADAARKIGADIGECVERRLTIGGQHNIKAFVAEDIVE